MSLVRYTIPNLINGVSQQPASLRLTSQAEDQVNAVSSVAEGLRKRPPTKYVAKMLDGSAGDAFFHTIDRDQSERYAVVITDGDLQVFDLMTGDEKTVDFPDGKSYLEADRPSSCFRAVSVADYTFIVNKEKVVALGTSKSPERGVEALVQVRAANYETTYEIHVNGSKVADHTTGASGSLSTTAIASDLAGDLSSNLGAGWSITREGYVIHIAKDDGSDFEIKVTDTRAGQNLKLVKQTVQDFEDLPVIAPAGFVAHITGDPGSEFDDYWVKFQPNNEGASFDEGQWVETVAPGLEIELDPSTMPHSLVREGDGTFTFKQIEWSERKAGDDNTAPVPSLVGNKVRDLFFHKNRLGMIAGENVVASEAGEYFNLFRTTVNALLDSDPIDVGVSHNKVSILHHAEPFDSDLILFSAGTQFALRGGDLLTPKTVSLPAQSEFPCSTRCHPQAAGKNVYFAGLNDADTQFSTIREYFTDPNSNNKTADSVDVTSHVPAYIRGEVTKIAASPQDNCLVVQATGDADTLYLYQYFWDANQKLQSSWSKWTFSGDVLNVDFIGSVLYMVVQYSDGVYIEKLDVRPFVTDPYVRYETLIDRRITESECVSVDYDSGADTTTFSLPYTIDGTPQIVTRSDGEEPTVRPGRVIPVVENNGNSLVVRGDHTSTPVFIGERYAMEYVFSEPFVKEMTANGAEVSVTGGRLQVLRYKVKYDATAYFRAEVTLDARGEAKAKTFSGRILGSGSNIIGDLALEGGEFSVPVLSRSDQFRLKLINDSPFPSRFTSAGWEGDFTNRE